MKSLSTEAILALLNPEQQKELFYTLEAKFNNEPDSTHTKAKELQDKYFDLVWFARSRVENHRLPDVKAAYDKVLAKYPQDIEQLRGENGDWQHGFNSGMLACSRLLGAYALPHDLESKIDTTNVDLHGSSDSDDDEEYVSTRKGEIEMANDDFPCLDT